MDINTIQLNFDKSLSGLAGYDFGKEIYTHQVKGKMDYNKKNIIMFPDNIERIASSFIQGFFAEIVDEIGIEGIERKIDFQSAKINIKDKVLQNLV